MATWVHQAKPFGRGELRPERLPRQPRSGAEDGCDGAKSCQFWPAPNRPGDPLTGQDNFVFTVGVPVSTDQYTIRVDHNLSDSRRWFARWSQKRQFKTEFPEFFGHDNAGGAGFTNVFSPTFVLNVNFGFGPHAHREVLALHVARAEVARIRATENNELVAPYALGRTVGTLSITGVRHLDYSRSCIRCCRMIGVGFLASPVVQSLGGGFLGRDFGWRFASPVLSAHAAFGIVLGLVLRFRPGCTCHCGCRTTELSRQA